MGSDAPSRGVVSESSRIVEPSSQCLPRIGELCGGVEKNTREQGKHFSGLRHPFLFHMAYTENYTAMTELQGLQPLRVSL